MLQEILEPRLRPFSERVSRQGLRGLQEILQRPQDPSLTDTLGRTPLGMTSDGERLAWLLGFRIFWGLEL